jgi:hypothetical protein
VKRHLSKLEKAKLWALGGQGLAPKDILCILRKEFANIHSMAREIYNELVVARTEELRGRWPIEALVELISCSNYFSKVWLVEGAVDYVFFMHQSSVSMCQTFGMVFLLDCTYKTNKFGMPLLNVVGITSTYATFNAGFAFLHEENEEVYAWVFGTVFRGRDSKSPLHGPRVGPNERDCTSLPRLPQHPLLLAHQQEHSC